MSQPDLITAGALEITVMQAYSGPIPSYIQQALDRQIANGQIVNVDVQGERGGVQRLSPTKVRLGFYWTNSAGHREEVVVQENRSADAVLQVARSLTQGEITTAVP